MTKYKQTKQSKPFELGWWQPHLFSWEMSTPSLIGFKQGKRCIGILNMQHLWYDRTWLAKINGQWIFTIKPAWRNSGSLFVRITFFLFMAQAVLRNLPRRQSNWKHYIFPCVANAHVQRKFQSSHLAFNVFNESCEAPRSYCGKNAATILAHFKQWQWNIEQIQLLNQCSLTLSLQRKLYRYIQLLIVFAFATRTFLACVAAQFAKAAIAWLEACRRLRWLFELKLAMTFDG